MKPGKGGPLVIGIGRAEEDDAPELDELGGEEKTSAARAVMKALKADDAGALSDALERHRKACMGDYGDEDDAAEED